MRVLVVGAGAVGARAARQLVESDEVREVVVVDIDPVRQAAVVESSGRKARGGSGEDAGGRRAPRQPVRHARGAGHAPRRRGPTGRVDQRLHRGRSRAPRPGRGGSGAGRLRRGRAHRSPPGTRASWPGTRQRVVRLGDRAARREERHRRSRLRPPAPSRPHRAGPRLARRRLAPTARRLGPGAVLVPRPDRSRGLLPRRAPGRAAAGAGLRRGWSGSPPAWRPRGATACRPTSRCCASPTRRVSWARCASRCGAGGPAGARCVVLGALDRPAVAAGATAALAARWAGAGRLPAGLGRTGGAGRQQGLPGRAGERRDQGRRCSTARPDART